MQAKADWPQLCLYQKEDEALSRAGGTKVVFLGDSITELWQFADPSLFTDGMVDRGISGQTSAQTLLRFQQDVVGLHPKAVHILIGANDVAGNTGPERPEDYKNNVRSMVELAKAHGIKVILASITPASGMAWIPSLRPAARIRELNDWLRTYARQAHLAYVDYYAALTAPDGGMPPGYSRDGVHPLVKAYRIMRPLTDAALETALRARP